MGINKQKYEPKRPQYFQTVKLHEFKQKGFRQSDFYAFYII